MSECVRECVSECVHVSESMSMSPYCSAHDEWLSDFGRGVRGPRPENFKNLGLHGKW